MGIELNPTFHNSGSAANCNGWIEREDIDRQGNNAERANGSRWSVYCITDRGSSEFVGLLMQRRPSEGRCGRAWWKGVRDQGNLELANLSMTNTRDWDVIQDYRWIE